MITEEVQTHRRVLQSIINEWKRKPHTIVSDLSHTMSITAEMEGIPFMQKARIPRSVNGDEWRFWLDSRKLLGFREAVMPHPVGGDRSHGATFFTSILNFTWTNHAHVKLTPPEYHASTKIFLALGMLNLLEYLSDKLWTTNIYFRMLLLLWVMPFNKVRKSMGLRRKTNFYDQMSGDLILMPDFAGFKGMDITKTALPIGSLAWEPKDEEILAHTDKSTAARFQAFLDSDPERPLVYLTMGSTGTLELFRTVIAALRSKPYRLAITTGGQFAISSLGELPSNVFAIPFFPGNRILEKASVTINHGGSGSAYQAIAAQVPQIMIPTHPDQQWNADIVQAERAGIRLRHRSLTEGKIADAVEILLKK